MRLVRDQIQQGTKVMSQIRQELQRVSAAQTVRKNAKAIFDEPTPVTELFNKKDLKQVLYPVVKIDGNDY
jgi:hypothetical protein